MPCKKRPITTADTELGYEVEDITTGFKGIVTSKITYLNKCVQFGVVPRVGPDNVLKDTCYLDWNKLVVIGLGVNKTPVLKPTGGPNTRKQRGMM